MRRLAWLNLLAFPILFFTCILIENSLAWIWLSWAGSLILTYHWSCFRLIRATRNQNTPSPQFFYVALLLLSGLLFIPAFLLNRPGPLCVLWLAIFFCTRFVHFQILAHACGMPTHIHIYHLVPVVGVGIVGSVATQSVTSRFPGSGYWFLPLFLFDFLALPFFAASRLPAEAASPASDQATSVDKRAAPKSDNPFAEFRRKN